MKELVNDGFAKVVKPYIDAQDKKSREIIAPVEVSPAEAAHSIGDQIIFDGILYDVIAPIAVDDPLTATGAGANIELADDISAQIKVQKAEIQTVGAQAAANNKSTQEMIAPVEEDETDASRAYEIGEQLILDGILYDVIDDIAQHGIITAEGAGANIEVADTIAEQIKNKTITTDAVPTHGSTNPVQSGGTFDAILDEAKTRGELGAKNLLPNDATTQTIDGLTLTKNSDGTVNVHGTNSAAGWVNFLVSDTSILKKILVAYKGKNLILSTTEDYDYNTNNVNLSYIIGGETTYITPNLKEVEFTVPNNIDSAVEIAIVIGVNTGATANVDNMGIMLRPATDADDTYQPYAKTNRELTAENQTLTNKVANITNPNLLDNPWFTVNQRGQSSYTDSTGYCLDRWNRFSSLAVTVNADGSITITNNSDALAYFGQKLPLDIIPYLKGKKLTLSAKILSSGSNSTMYAGYGTSNDYVVLGSIAIPTSLDIINVGIDIPNNINDVTSFEMANLSIGAGESITVYSFKLEVGDISTLAMDTAPNYATELLKCQRYFYIIKNNNLLPVFNGFAAGSSRAQVTFNNPVQMRTAPTAVASSDLKFTIRHGSTKEENVTAGTVTAYADGNNQFNLLDFNTLSISTLTQNELLSVAITSGNVSFSADL